jgi:hypothetical protein
VKLPLALGPAGSVCVVFREGKAAAHAVAVAPARGLALERGADGSFSGWASEAGDFRVETADGRNLAVKVPAVPAPVEISGPWEVSFTPGWGAPEKTTFERLADWTSHADEGIRHYSGAAVYRKSFVLPEFDAAAGKLTLDLGAARDLATVRVNGREFPTLWLAPWQVDITAAAKPGENTLEIEVVNVWNNRLVGDALLPADQRRTFITVPSINKDMPLQPAGLLGPVTVRSAVKVSAKP